MNVHHLFRRLPPDARILLVRLRSMGDLLLLTSPVRALKAEFPRFRISVLVESRFAGVFEGNPDIHDVITVQGKAGALVRLAARRFDAVINLHGGPTSLLYTLAAGGRRVGGEQYPHRWAYSTRFPKPDPAIHTAASTLGTFRYLGVETRVAPPLRFERNVEAAQRVERMLEEAPPADRSAVQPGLLRQNAVPSEARPAEGNPPRNEARPTGTRPPYVVVHPAAVMETKRWPGERFARLVGWLQERGLRVVLTCGPGEDAMVHAVARDAPEAQVITGLTIPELAELIRGARLYVGNDSGPMHLATAVGTPTVAIWGSSSAVRWHPWGVEHRVVQNPFACNPCPGYRCLVADTPLCIESVTVEQAQAAVHELAFLRTGPHDADRRSEAQRAGSE